MPRKGIELPINTLVVVAVAVIILLGIVAFFMGGFSGASESIQKRQAFLNACQAYTQLGCQGDPPLDVQRKYFAWIERNERTATDKDELEQIKSACGCFGGTSGTGSASSPPPKTSPKSGKVGVV